MDELTNSSRFTPETMHDGTMRDQVLQRMLDNMDSEPTPPSAGLVPPSPPPVTKADAPVVVDRGPVEYRQQAQSHQQEIEETVAEHDASNQEFLSMLLALGSQGVELMVEMPDRQLVGRVVHVGSDLVGLETIGGERFDLVPDAIGGIRVTRGQARPGSVSTGHPNTITARLREALAVGESVAISRQIGQPMGGELKGVSECHAQGIDHNQSYWILPTGKMTWMSVVGR